MFYLLNRKKKKITFEDILFQIFYCNVPIEKWEWTILCYISRSNTVIKKIPPCFYFGKNVKKYRPTNKDRLKFPPNLKNIENRVGAVIAWINDHMRDDMTVNDLRKSFNKGLSVVEIFNHFKLEESQQEKIWREQKEVKVDKILGRPRGSKNNQKPFLIVSNKNEVDDDADIYCAIEHFGPYKITDFRKNNNYRKA